MPTHETSCISLEASPIPPGTPIAPAEAASAVCSNLPGGSPSTILAASVDNTLGRGRIRATTGAGVAFTLRLTVLLSGSPRVLLWPLSPSSTVVGPNDNDGTPLYPNKITKIETVDSAGAPLAPGATVQLEWIRPGGRIAADKAADLLGVYPGDALAPAQPGKWMPVRDRGPVLGKCSGGWAALDDLVAGPAGTIRKRAASGDEAAQSVGTAQEAALNGAQGLINLG